MATRIVTECASDIANDTTWKLGIAVVAQNVHFGTRTFKDNVTITPDESYSMLPASTELPKTPMGPCPSTSRPRPAAPATRPFREPWRLRRPAQWR